MPNPLHHLPQAYRSFPCQKFGFLFSLLTIPMLLCCPIAIHLSIGHWRQSLLVLRFSFPTSLAPLWPHRILHFRSNRPCPLPLQWPAMTLDDPHPAIG